MDADHHAYSCKFVPLSLREFCGTECSTVVYQQNNKAFFVYGFAKNERASISDKELKYSSCWQHNYWGIPTRRW
jgi:hypothetical protein